MFYFPIGTAGTSKLSKANIIKVKYAIFITRPFQTKWLEQKSSKGDLARIDLNIFKIHTFRFKIDSVDLNVQL